MNIDLKRLATNVAGTAGARGINLLIALAQIPLLVGATSVDEYAVVAMTISLSTFATYADFGIGLAIVNTLAAAAGKPSIRVQRAVSVAWFSMLAVAIVGLICTIAGIVLVAVYVGTDHQHQYYVMVFGVALVAVGLPTGLVQRILFAQQKNAVANLWVTAGKLLSLIGLWGLINAGITDLIFLVFSLLGIPVIVGWVSVATELLCKNGLGFKPRVYLFKWKAFKHYSILGMSFLIMQLVPFAEYSLDILIVGSVISKAMVQSYDVYQRLYNYIPALISMAVFPLWPLIAEARGCGDVKSVRKIANWFYIIVALVSTSLTVIFLLADGWLISLWVTKPISINYTTQLGFAVFTVLTCIGTVQVMILNGLGHVAKLAKIFIYYLIALSFVKVYFANEYGTVGLIWSMNLLYTARLVFLSRLSKRHA